MITYPNLHKPLRYIGANQSRVRKTAYTGLKCHLLFMKALCKRLIDNPDPLIVEVYSFKELPNAFGNYKYQYDMKAMGMLSEAEKRVVNMVSKYCEPGDAMPTDLADINLAWKKHPAIMTFLQKVLFQNRYFDIHDGNIMIDENEEYKLVDLEGFIGSSQDNKWVYQNETP